MAGVWLAIFFGGLIASASGAANQASWALAVVPCVAGLLVLWATRRIFPLTGLAYLGVLGYCLLRMAEGHYTTPAAAPAALAGLLGRVDFASWQYFVEGLLVALLAREVLIRRRVLARRGWLAFLVVCISLAVSASGELLAWGITSLADLPRAALGSASAPPAHLLLTTLGACISLGAGRRFHDRQLRKFSSL